MTPMSNMETEDDYGDEAGFEFDKNEIDGDTDAKVAEETKTAQTKEVI